MRWRRAANCSISGCRRQGMHDRQLLWAVYVVSLAFMTTTSAESDGWNQQHAECDHWDISAPGRAGIGTRAQQAWSRYWYSPVGYSQWSRSVESSGVPRVWILAERLSQSWSPNLLKSRSQSPAKRRLRTGRTCFYNLIEYNEIMDGA